MATLIKQEPLYDYNDFNRKYKENPVEFIKKNQKEEKEWSAVDLRRLRYVMGEQLPDKLVGDEEIEVISQNVTAILNEKLAKIGINKVIKYHPNDIRKIVTSIEEAHAYYTPEQTRRDAIAIIVSQTMDLYDTINTNFSLDPSVILYTGECGIRSHGPIKIREKKRPTANFWIY